MSLWPATAYWLHALEAVLLFAVAAFMGRIPLRRMRLGPLGLVEELLFGLGLGLGTLALSVLAVGLSHLLAPPVLWGLLFVSAAAGLAGLRAYPLRVAAGPEIQRASAPWIAVGALAMMAVVLFMSFTAASAPEIFYDALIYHLALPRLYLIRHAVVPTPFNAFSGVPFNTEMLYALGLGTGGEGLAKLIPLGAALSLVAGLWSWCRRFSRPDVGVLAALLLTTVPMFASETWSALVEILWCFFAFLAVYSLLIGLEGEGENWFVVSGVMTGFALGVKYNAIWTFAAVVALIVLAREKALARVLRFSIPAVLLILPWLLKNIVFYHNPIFPFFNEAFGGLAQVDWRGFVADAKSRDLRATFSTMKGFKELLVSPFSARWISLDAAGVAVLLGTPPLLLVRWKSPAYRRLFAAFVLSCAAWAVSSSMPRFLIFALPLWALLLATAVHQSRMRLAATALIFLACAVNCGELFNNWFASDGWRVVLAGLSKSEYLDHNRGMYPAPYYAAMAFVNSRLPDNAKVLFLGECRTYYCEKDSVSNSPFAREPLAQWAERAETGEQLRDRLVAEGITHVFVNRMELARLGYLRLGPEATKRFEEFSKYTRQVFESKRDDPKDPEWLQVFEIVRSGR